MLWSPEGISIAIYGSVILKKGKYDKLIGFTNNFYKVVAISGGESRQRNDANIKNNESVADVEVDGAMNFSLLGSHSIGNRNNQWTKTLAVMALWQETMNELFGVINSIIVMDMWYVSF